MNRAIPRPAAGCGTLQTLAVRPCQTPASCCDAILGIQVMMSRRICL
jgi:hypothetical protein